MNIEKLIEGEEYVLCYDKHLSYIKDQIKSNDGILAKLNKDFYSIFSQVDSKSIRMKFVAKHDCYDHTMTELNMKTLCEFDVISFVDFNDNVLEATHLKFFKRMDDGYSRYFYKASHYDQLEKNKELAKYSAGFDLLKASIKLNETYENEDITSFLRSETFDTYEQALKAFKENYCSFGDFASELGVSELAMPVQAAILFENVIYEFDFVCRSLQLADGTFTGKNESTDRYMKVAGWMTAEDVDWAAYFIVEQTGNLFQIYELGYSTNPLFKHIRYKLKLTDGVAQ